MNLIDNYVLEILSDPYFNHLWCVNVVADSYGHVSETTVNFTCFADAKNLKIGDVFKS